MPLTYIIIFQCIVNCYVSGFTGGIAHANYWLFAKVPMAIAGGVAALGAGGGTLYKWLSR